MPERPFWPTTFLSDQRGGVSVMLVLMLIPMIAVLGMAMEGSGWFLGKRGLQNAADSAAIAASLNHCRATDPCHTTDRTFDYEAQAVAASFGFANGVSNTTVAAVTVACPADSTKTCYSVTITKLVPIGLVGIMGYNGDATISGRPALTIAANAIASSQLVPNTYCLLALASGGTNVQGIRSNGGNNIDLTGCKVATNGKATCNGHNLKAAEVDAGGSSSNCAADPPTGVDKTGQPHLNDPYAALASSIPSDACGTAKANFTPPAAGNTLATSLTLTATPKVYCGNVTVPAGGTAVKTPAGGSVIVIVNGSLTIPSGATFSTTAVSSDAPTKPSGLTVIFTGRTTTPSISPTYTLLGGGVVDVAAPTSGTWSGVAIYTNPALTTGVNWSAAGNSPTWKITGLIYLPHAAVTFSGNVNKGSNGQDCFALVVDTFLSNGTGTILEHQTQCSSAGLTPPSGGTVVRQALVQ
jgi:hypothetical protein